MAVFKLLHVRSPARLMPHNKPLLLSHVQSAALRDLDLLLSNVHSWTRDLQVHHVVHDAGTWVACSLHRSQREFVRWETQVSRPIYAGWAARANTANSHQ